MTPLLRTPGTRIKKRRRLRGIGALLAGATASKATSPFPAVRGASSHGTGRFLKEPWPLWGQFSVGHAPSPRPRAPLGPSQRRPYGQLPSTIVCRVRGSCWGGRHRLLGPYPHRWVRGTGCGWAPRAARPLPSPVVSWVRPKCTWNEGLGDEKRGIFPGEQQPENTSALTLPEAQSRRQG